MSNWRDHLLPTGSLAVEFSGQGSGIDSTHFGALKVKDTIVDKIARQWRPAVGGRAQPRTSAYLRLDRGEAVLSLDLSGHSLHQRAATAPAQQALRR